MTQNAILCRDKILNKIGDRRPKIGVMLGSGMQPFADQLTDPIVIPYEELPGFPQLTIAGHDGKLVIAQHKGHTIACLCGRVHFYEGAGPDQIKTMVRTLKLLGCEIFINTNSSGSLRQDTPPGELMIITDHINFSFKNPLVGPNDADFGPRFFSMDNGYDLDLIHRTHRVAGTLDIPLQQGVYLGVLGPNFETPAEIRAFRAWGADCVGMSTIPDNLVARHCGMRLLCIAAITNFAAGMNDFELSHDVTLQGAQLATSRLLPLLDGLLTDLLESD